MEAKIENESAGIVKISVSDIASEFDELKDPGLSDFADKRITDLSEIDDPVPVISINGETISTPGNITTFSGQAKSGKSAFLQPLIAAALSVNVLDEFEGFKVDHSSDGANILIDSEQARHKLKKTVKAIIRRGALTTCPDNFLAYSFLGLGVQESKDNLTAICKAAKAKFGRVHLIVVDGIADFVTDPNDLKESKEIVRYMMNLAIDFNCPVITIIHTNPGSNKEMGHLGSQLQRKSESVIEIKSDKDISTIEPKFLRMAGKGKIPPIQFGYDDSKGYHVYLGHKEAKKEGLKVDDLMNLAKEVMGNGLTLRYGSLTTKVCDHSGCSVATAKRHIKDMIDLEIIVKGKDGGYYIKR